MVTAISFLRLKGWHAPAGRLACEPRPLVQDGQIGSAPPVGARKLGPGRQIVSKTARCGVSRFGGQAGTQVSDATPPPSENRGSRAGSTTHILPAESVLDAISEPLRVRALQIIRFCVPLVRALAPGKGNGLWNRHLLCRRSRADVPGCRPNTALTRIKRGSAALRRVRAPRRALA